MITNAHIASVHAVSDTNCLCIKPLHFTQIMNSPAMFNKHGVDIPVSGENAYSERDQEKIVRNPS